MAETATTIDAKAALDMLELFTSVGVDTFDLTVTSLQGDKVLFRSGQTIDALRRTLPELLTGSVALQRNLIVRPRAAGNVLIQLDDLAADAIARVQSAAFLVLETSPGNHQAWVAVPAGIDSDFARRLRKGTGADATASGATRIAGSLNFKEKYAPNFPNIAIRHAAPARVSRAKELTALGLVAPPETAPAAPVRVSRPRRGRAWPSYERCLEGAPLNHGQTGPDISRADFTWCMTAIDWGWKPDDVAVRLMELSSKARENGERYAGQTAQNAAAAIARRRGQMPGS